jgi:hypothetical protein
LPGTASKPRPVFDRKVLIGFVTSIVEIVGQFSARSKTVAEQALLNEGGLERESNIT